MSVHLDRIQEFIEAELEQRREGGTDCPQCWDGGEFGVPGPGVKDCPKCKGTGRDPYITAAEQALRDVELERKSRETDRISALKAEYLDRQLWQFVSLDEWLNGPKSVG